MECSVGVQRRTRPVISETLASHILSCNTSRPKMATSSDLIKMEMVLLLKPAVKIYLTSVRFSETCLSTLAMSMQSNLNKSNLKGYKSILGYVEKSVLMTNDLYNFIF